MQATTEIDDAPGIPEDEPYIFLLIPFEPKMKTRTGFDDVLNAAASKTEKDLLQKYPADHVKPVIEKLYKTIREMDHEAHNKSIVIIVSPLVAKVHYFNYIPVEWDRYKIA